MAQSQQSNSAKRPAISEQRIVGSDFLDRMGIVWAILFYAAHGLGLVASLREQPTLASSWSGLAMLGLVIGSGLLFQIVFQPMFNSSARWPLSAKRAWIYFGGQLLLLVGLLLINNNFIGFSFALMGQTFGSLRPRNWPLPLIVIFGVLSWATGMVAELAAGNWISMFSLLFSITVSVVIGLLISRLFQQRYALLGLVGELRNAKAAIEAGAAQQEELAVLRERTRLAREMHDSVGHALVLVNVKLEAAQRLYRVDTARADDELEATRGLVRETMTALRSSLHDLRAPLQQDLSTTLERLAAEVCARSRLMVHSEADEPIGPTPATGEVIWRIAREALSNVERHAAAASAGMALTREGDCWVLRVIDDGSGVRPDDLSKPGHFGVLGMRERAESLGGSLRVARRPEGGTMVEARIPVLAEDE